MQCYFFLDIIDSQYNQPKTALLTLYYCSCHARETRVLAQTPSHVQAHVDTLTIAADGETDPDMCVRWESD